MVWEGDIKSTQKASHRLTLSLLCFTRPPREWQKKYRQYTSMYDQKDRQTSKAPSRGWEWEHGFYGGPARLLFPGACRPLIPSNHKIKGPTWVPIVVKQLWYRVPEAHCWVIEKEVEWILMYGTTYHSGVHQLHRRSGQAWWKSPPV